MNQEEMIQELAYLRKVKDEDTALIISLSLQVQDLKRQRDNAVDEYKEWLRKEIEKLIQTPQPSGYALIKQGLIEVLKIIDKTK